MSEEEFQVIQDNQARAAAVDRPADTHDARTRQRYAANRAAKSEAELEATCTNILIQDGWRYLKTDPVSRRAHGKGFGELGMADGLYIRYRSSPPSRLGCTVPAEFCRSEVMWIEWKREKGGVVADHQRDWHTAEREKGALVLVGGEDFPATIEGFCDWYQRSGLMWGIK